MTGSERQRWSRAPLSGRLPGNGQVFAEDLGPVAQQISIRNAAFGGFSPLFMRLVAVSRIEALF